MPAGRLRERVRLQEKARSDDGGGGGAVNWLDVRTVWAEVKPMTVNQRLEAEQVQSDLTHTVTIRYRPDVTEGMRLKYRSRFLLIQSVVNVGERRTWLQLMCEEMKDG